MYSTVKTRYKVCYKETQHNGYKFMYSVHKYVHCATLAKNDLHIWYIDLLKIIYFPGFKTYFSSTVYCQLILELENN